MRPHTIRTWTLSLLVAVGLLGMPGGAWGQDRSDPLSRGKVQVVAPSSSRTFGTANGTIYRIAAAGLAPVDSFTAYAEAQTFSRSRISGTDGHFDAPVTLPAGATVTHLELDVCDSSGTEELVASLFECEVPIGGNCTLHGGVSTGPTDIPGCKIFVVTSLRIISRLTT
jgi:hypothetical protein